MSPAYHSGNLSKTGRPDFNYPLRPMAPDLTLPLAPHNLLVTTSYKIGATDIRWDDPTLLPLNSPLHITGVNVYRSQDTPFGPYIKLNDSPLGVLFYRDETLETLVTEEDVTQTLVYSTEPDGTWDVYVKNKPIIVPGTNGTISNRIQDVQVEIDSGDGVFKAMPAFAVDGKFGKITLISNPTYNNDLQQIIPPRLPWPPNGKVRVTYKYLKHSVLTRLSQRIYYKVTAVAVDPKDNSKRIETPIDEVEWRSLADIDEIDWMWREAIRRIRWKLEQAGERVKIYVRAGMGERCPNYEESHGQGYGNCLLCLDTNFIPSYYGPYEAIIAAPEAERSIELVDMGLHVRYDYATFMGPFPILNERDIIIRQTNERYIVGPVNYEGTKGAIYQQHFTISYIDEGDIRYKVGITDQSLVPAGDRVPAAWDKYRQPTPPSPDSPVIPVNPAIPPERYIKGKSVNWDNITF